MTHDDFEGLVNQVATRLCTHEYIGACNHHKNEVRSVLTVLQMHEIKILERLHDAR